MYEFKVSIVSIYTKNGRGSIVGRNGLAADSEEGGKIRTKY